ncbi:MAG TPA: hypothetical protein VF494_04655 [Candidatus Limnocylindrales bacterium]
MRLIDGLRWPVFALIVTGAVHLAAEALRPDLRNAFTPATIGPVLLVYGLWVGYGLVVRGASFAEAVTAGVLVGLLPLALDIVGFGIILGRGVDAGLTAGAFGLLVVLFGALAGAGYASSRAANTAA